MSWRLATIDDVQEIERLHQEQERALGATVDRPNLFDKPVFMTMVREVDGKIVGGFFIEAQAELQVLGVDQETTASMHEIADQVYYHLRKAGFRTLHTFIPKRRTRALRRFLLQSGFQVFKGHSHWFRSLLKKEER